jgi:uncharacterized protein YdhG (YjbR/CyaY superfamily)
MVNHPQVDAYMLDFSGDKLERLQLIRNLIHECADDAEEHFAYGMPAYRLNKKPLLYFAGFEHHTGFYATPTGHSAFEERLKGYKQGKGSVQFPHNQDLPVSLIRDIILYRVEENRSRKR